MKDEDQIIALAKWEGWTIIEKSPGQFVAWASPDDHWSQQPTDYLKDLNAVHRLVATWAPDDGEMQTYMRELKAVVAPHHEPWEPMAVWCMINATGRQRCEALLRTLGLWKEEK